MNGHQRYSARLSARREAVLERVLGPVRQAGAAPKRRRVGASIAVVAMLGGLVSVSAGGFAAQAAAVGQGFTVTSADLDHILRQIKIAEHHVTTATPADPCAGLLGTAPNQVPSPLVADGLRTIDGSCNNLQPSQSQFGAADQPFPRLTAPDFRSAEGDPGLFGPPGPQTTYAQTSGFVFDTQPRVISNLIVDQTSTNPAAVQAAGFPVRTQGNAGVVPCVTPGVPVGCVPAGETLFIPNVTTDVGLSPPYNSLFTIFGQFFDHGLDKITNGGNGTVVVPLNADDPLIAGPDTIPGNADDPVQCTDPPANTAPVGCDPNFVPVNLRFMTLTRGTNVTGPGPDGVLGTGDDTSHEAVNTDSPWVDLSQAYTSHPSHQVFLREYSAAAVGAPPQATGRLLSNADGSMANWGDVKAQTAALLGIQLVDTDVGNIPMIAADAYGNFIPGPTGFPQLVTSVGPDLVAGTADDVKLEGNPLAPVSTAGAVRIATAFLNDIAHSAAPNGVPDLNSTPGTSLTPADCTGVTSPCYDDELLDLHVIAGDGRANENIGLTSIHTIFEHEHNRLTVDEQNTLGLNPDLLAMYHDTNCAFGCATNNPLLPTTFTYGERVFQAARFVTEMEYQHLVFEEFARKVQPAINPFNLFAFSSTATNPAIKAEFAHAVYRFGHSMLDETIPRTNVDGSTNDISLLDGFLNPAAFKEVTAGDLAAAGGDMGGAGAGAIVMGLSDQVGNELDEFVSNQLRNNLLGLPLDLPSLNMTRARSEGIASLNNVRKQIFAATGDGQMTPYTDWVDFGLHIKHPESLINFVAAYGQHPTILAETTLVGKRNAARAIVDPLITDTPPVDAADFMFSTGAWANVGDVSKTGVDGIDLWVGGLAEVTNLFGGLLGTTFNYVFELQLTQLQDNDRLYYLNRTPGMNLRTQLEGNSFAELVMRNTTATALKADSFATADCKFELGLITFPASPGTNIAGGPNLIGVGSVNDVPSTECDENALLIRATSGQIRYRPINTVDPSGINGQSVYNGTAGVDLVAGGNDNDTFRGNAGNDILEGNGGDDNLLGGDGNDIITDAAGFDTLKGGPGNDALDGGIGDDLLLGGDGNDLTVGGANTNVHFDGPGDDFILAGQGADEVDGDSGNDWMEGGDQTDLLQGDSGSLFFDDHNAPGNDIMIGQAGDDDYDMEGGDDIGVAGPGIEKNAGAAGFDWSIGQSDPQAQDADLALPILGLGIPVNGVRDRFNEVEALSGWNLNDTLHGDDIIPSQRAGGGFIGCDALDQNGLDRIAGLDPIVPPLTVPSGPIVAASASHHCDLVGNVWGEGNILLGGAGSDTIEGRGADDIIDGDRYLGVRIAITGLPGGAASAALVENIPTGPGWTGPLAGKTLQAAVFAGLVDPGNMVAVREIITPPALAADCGATTPLNCDTAVFSGPRNEYTITFNGDGSLTVADNGAAGRALDNSDTLWNIEQLSFCTTPGAVRGTCDLRAAPVSVGPRAVATPASVAFGNQNVGTTSAVRIISISNGGLTALNLSAVTIAGDASIVIVPASTTCTATTVLTGASSCNVGVRFAPTTRAAATATVAVSSNAATLNVPITGQGVAPLANASPASLAFGKQNLNTNSATQTVTLSNTGDAPLTIASAVVTGAGFTRLGGTCGASLAAGASCTITVRFRPTVAGVSVGALTITDNAFNGSPQTVSLSGEGVVQLPVASVSTTALAFGNVQVASSSNQDVTLTNTGTGTAAMSITSIAVTGTGFSRVALNVASGGCGTSLASGASCIIRVRFLPTVGGAATGNLVITDNSNNVAGSTQTVALSGAGTIVANNDTTSVVAPTGVAPANVTFAVRANDAPPNTGTVTINSSTFTNGGATAAVSVNANNQVVWTLSTNAATAALRAAARRGTYTVTYTLTSGTATSTATYTLTIT